MQGDGNEEGIIAEFTEALILFPSFGKESREVFGDKKAAPVFEAVDEVEGLGKSFEGGARETEVVRHAKTVLAVKGVFDISQEALTTVLTEGLFDPGEVRSAGGANAVSILQ